MKLTHYVVRDIHAEAPEDEPPGTHDVLAKAEDGRIFYCEDVFDSAEEAQAFLTQMLAEPYEFEYWEDKPLSASYYDSFCKHLTWTEAP